MTSYTSIDPWKPEDKRGTREHPACAVCPHFDECLTTRWNEDGHPGWPVAVITSDTGTVVANDLSDVHTCRVCKDHVLNVRGDDSEPKRIVPDACPRWSPRRSSAWACSGCQRDGHRFVGRTA